MRVSPYKGRLPLPLVVTLCLWVVAGGGQVFETHRAPACAGMLAVLLSDSARGELAARRGRAGIERAVAPGCVRRRGAAAPALRPEGCRDYLLPLARAPGVLASPLV